MLFKSSHPLLGLSLVNSKIAVVKFPGNKGSEYT